MYFKVGILMKKMTGKKGFTLVELVVVIAIIGILAAILVPLLVGATRDAHVASVNQTAGDVRKLLNSWLAQKNAEKIYTTAGNNDGSVYVEIRCSNGHFDTPNFVGNFWSDSNDIADMQLDLQEYCEKALGNLQKYAVAYLVNGRFEALYYVEMDSAPPGAPLPADFNRTNFWANQNGIGQNGIIIGTSPAIING